MQSVGMVPYTAAPDSPRHKPSAFYLWVCQTDALLRKNVEVLLRQSKLLCIIITAPMFAVLLLWIILQLQIPSNPPITETALSPIGCTVFNLDGTVDLARSSGCVNLAFAPNTTRTREIMTTFSQQTGWALNSQILAMNSADDVAAFIFNSGYLAKLDAAIIFKSVSSQSVSYSLWVNNTAPYELQKDSFHFGGLQVALDRAIIKVFTNITADLEVTITPFSDQSIGTQAANSNVSTTDTITFVGAVMVLFAVLFVMILIIFLITTEKKMGLIGQMRMMGLMDSALWLSWLAVFFVTSVFSALLFAAVAVATPVLVFHNTSFGVLFFFMLCTLLCCVGYAFFTASVVRQPKWVTAISFTTVVVWISVTFVFQSMGSPNEYYDPGVAVFTKFMLFTQPWFHFNKIFSDLLQKTGGGPDNQPVGFYTWGDLSVSPPTFPNAPSAGQSMGYMIALLVIYFILAWYLGQVFGGDFSKPVYFFLTPDYWGKKRVDETLFQGDTQGEVRQASIDNGDVRLHKMSKSYDQTTALKELSLTMRRGEIFCLLGQNGAGKSTAINCLTGLHNCTHGNAFVFGLSINHQINEIQSMMGVCSQDDYLFPELSGSAHLSFWARFKGLTRVQVAQEVTRTLEDVSLTSAASAPAGTYSGGMKRRLSVGIASMGNPKIIFLDEPTTGLDPLSRRRVWSMIERLKEGRVICLTTHSMEEADVLGSEIAILASGRLRAIGSSLFLKNRFGRGYQVTLMTDGPSEADRLVSMVTQMLPGADIISNSAGYVVVGIPKGVASFIPRFFKHLETDGSGLVKEWGISNTTLEEVFLRLAVQNKEVNSNGVQSAEGQSERLIVEPVDDAPVDVTRSDGTPLRLQQVTVVTGLGVNVLPNLSIYTLATRQSETPALMPPPSESEFLLTAPSSTLPPYDGSVHEQKYDSPFVQQEHHQHHQQQQQVPVVSLVGSTQQSAPLPPPPYQTKERTEGFGDITMWGQIRGLLLKSASLQKYQRKTNCCSICFLILLCLTSVLLGLLIPSGGRSPTPVCTENFRTYCVCKESGADWSNEVGDLYSMCTKEGFVEFITKETKCNSESCNTSTPLCVGYPNQTTCVPDLIQPGGARQQAMWVDTTASARCSGTLNYPSDLRVWVSERANVKKSFLTYDIFGLNEGVTDVYYQKTTSQGATAKFTKINSSVETAVAASQRVLGAGLTSGDNAPCYAGCSWSSNNKQALYFAKDFDTAEKLYKSLFPDFGLDIYRSDPYNMSLVYNLAVFASANARSYGGGVSYPLASIWTPYPGSSYYSTCASIIPDEASFSRAIYSSSFNGNEWTEYNVATLIEGMTRAMLNTAHNVNLQQIQVTMVAMPAPRWMQDDGNLDLMLFLAMFLLPMATMLTFTPAVQTTLLEKSTKVVVMMKMQGLNSKIYWFSTWLWNMITYLEFVGFFVILNYAVSAQPYPKANVGTLILTLILWGNALIGCGFLFSAFLTKGTLATVLSIGIVMIQMSLGPIMVQAYPLDTSTWPLYLDFFPQLSFVHALYLSFANSPAHNGEIWKVLGLLFLEGLVVLFLGAFFQITRQEGSSDAKFFNCGKRCSSKHDLSASLLAGEEEVVDEDIDVRQERLRVKAGIKNDAIQLLDFGKTFPSQRGRPPKIAVKSTSLSVNYGECFGLLGPNGAGKTTTLNILSGYMDPSRGTAHICGYDVVGDIGHVHKVLGMCPQFDWVWEELTVEDHLLLYVRLKGALRKAEHALVQKIAEAVELDGDALGTTAGALSGGMRRRLSLAIALCGDPRVIFLDEPTTGLDPETRQGMWKIISKTKENRCIVLTTHSMEEADALCERIGIMAEGSLQCLGSQLHLKHRFGSGYQLKLNLEPNDQLSKEESLKAIDNFVATLSSSPPLLTSMLGDRSRAYSLERQTTSISNVFAAMERRPPHLGIREWGITMTTLDEVFLRIVEAAEDRAAN